MDLEEDAWDQVKRVNVHGTFLCSRAVALAIIRQGRGGTIIMLSSSKGQRGDVCYAAYSASKFAVIGFAQSLALELAPHEIRVNTICLGMVDTLRIRDIAAAMVPADESVERYTAQILSERTAAIPLGRVATSEDVTNVAAFLASSESDYLTGLAISVSGGTRLG